jgi:hypothetical protein
MELGPRLLDIGQHLLDVVALPERDTLGPMLGAESFDGAASLLLGL